MVVKEIEVKDIMTKTNLPVSDYVALSSLADQLPQKSSLYYLPRSGTN